jgi:hypothetical protein
VLDCQVSHQAQGRQRNQQVIEIKALEKLPSNGQAGDKEDAGDDRADVPGDLEHRPQVSSLNDP